MRLLKHQENSIATVFSLLTLGVPAVAQVELREAVQSAVTRSSTKRPAKVYSDMQVGMIRQLVLPLANGFPFVTLKMPAFSRPNAAFDLRITGNLPNLTAEQLKVEQDKFVGMLGGNPQYSALARKILDIAVFAKGDPMALAVYNLPAYTQALSQKQMISLFRTLASNPFLAEFWNAHATKNVANSSAQAEKVSEEKISEGDVTNIWVSNLESTYQSRAAMQVDVLLAAQNFAAKIEQMTTNPGKGWEKSDAQNYQELHNDFLAKTETLVRSVGDIKLGSETLASIYTLAALASCPEIWDNSQNSAMEILKAASKLHSALLLQRLDVQSSTVLLRQLLDATRSRIRLVARVCNDIQNCSPKGKDEQAAASAEYANTWFDEITLLCYETAASFQAGKIDPNLRDRIDSLNQTPEGLLTAPKQYEGQRLLNLWRVRALDRAERNLTITDCQPDSGFPLSAALYGLAKLNPAIHPGLFASWAELETPQGSGLNIKLFAHSVKQLLELESNSQELEIDAAKLMKRAEAAQAFIGELSTKGIANLVNLHFRAVVNLLTEVAKLLGKGHGELRSSNWTFQPNFMAEQVPLTDQAGSKSTSRIAKVISRLRTEGDPLNEAVKKIEAYKIAIERILDTFSNGGPQYQALRKAILETSRDRKLDLMDSAEILSLISEMESNKTYAGELLYSFIERMEAERLAIVELAEQCKGQGGRSYVLDQLNERLKK